MINFPAPGDALALAQELATLLPGPYTAQTIECDRTPLAALTRGDERIVLLHRTWAERNNNRICFVGLPLRCDPTDFTSLSLGVNFARTSVWRARPVPAIATEIERRLLPTYREKLTAQRAELDQKETLRREREIWAAHLALQLPGGQHIRSEIKSALGSDLILFGDTAAAHGSLTVHSDEQGMSYSLSFQDRPEFLVGLLDLIRAHYPAPKDTADDTP